MSNSSSIAEVSPPIERTGKELLIASKTYAHELRRTSWWHLCSTFVLLGFLVWVASSPRFQILASVSASILAGFVVVRVFVIYHDFLHGAILRNSRFANLIFYWFGLVVLSPVNHWKQTHDQHHKSHSDKFGAEIGGFPLMTTDDYHNSSVWSRLGYRIVRSPFCILFGYVTTFLLSKTIVNFVRAPRRNLQCGFALVVHFGLAVLLAFVSLKAMLLGMMLPLFIGSAVGTYLFYVQHNFPGMKRKEGKEWDYVYAALHSSSFLKLSPMMNWLTGNIGYHHVHHLNSKIPFYRLPEAMNGLKELQAPFLISLSLSDITKCLKLKLWDPTSESLLTFREASRLRQLNDLDLSDPN